MKNEPKEAQEEETDAPSCDHAAVFIRGALLYCRKNGCCRLFIACLRGRPGLVS